MKTIILAGGMGPPSRRNYSQTETNGRNWRLANALAHHEDLRNVWSQRFCYSHGI